MAPYGSYVPGTNGLSVLCACGALDVLQFNHYAKTVFLSCGVLLRVGTWFRVAELLKDKIKAWRGKLSLKEAAAVLDIDYPSMRKYACGKRTPCKLAMIELERRMAQHANGK